MSEVLGAVTDDSFDDMVLQSKVPTLVDFFSTWCAPCRQIAPILDSAAKDFAGKVNFLKLDITDNRGTPIKYNVRGIPTLILFKDGKPIATHVGGDLSKSKLESFINDNL